MDLRKKAVVAGHICIDITPIFPDYDNKKIENIIIPGKLIHMHEVNIHTGGSVANTGLAMNFFGVDVHLMGKIGDDEFGNMILNILSKYGCNDSMIVSNSTDTSYSIVLAMSGIDRIFLHNPGANDTFICDDINFSCIEKSCLFHFGYPTLMKMMYQDNGKEFIKMIKKIKSLNTAISVDLSAVDASSEAGKVNWLKILEDTIPYIDFFVPSIEELCFMLDRPRYNTWIKKANGRDIIEILKYDDIKSLADKVMELGGNVLLIKCGALGMYYRSNTKEKLSKVCSLLNLSLDEWTDKEGFETSYIPDNVISGTGAGDTSIAAFLAAILKEYSLQKSLQMATATGACCVSAYDSLSGLKSFNEIEKKIQNGWKKQYSLKDIL